MLNRLLAIARKQLEIRLAVLLVVDRSNGTLKARLHSGLSLPENVTKVKIDPRKSKLLTHLLGAPDLLHWEGPRGEDDLDGLLLQLTSKEPAAIILLYRRGKPFAIMVACRPQRGTQLSTPKLKFFRQLGDAAMAALDSRAREVLRPAA